MTLPIDPLAQAWRPPLDKELFLAMDATWPAAEICKTEGWDLRRGAGGGKRVSAATVNGAGADVAIAEAAMQAWGQTCLFMIRPQDSAVDATLMARGYTVVDPVVLYAAPLQGLQTHSVESAIEAEFPLAAMARIWATGGIGPARLQVMQRADGPRCYILVRHRDQPAGVGFVALSDGVAMLHAVEVAQPFRRSGLGRTIAAAAARWGVAEGAQTLALATTRENVAANALYKSLGLEVAGHYHYRMRVRT